MLFDVKLPNGDEPTFGEGEPVTLPTAKPIVILSTGQSNMPSRIPYAWNPASNLMVWDFDANNQASTVVGSGFLPANPDEIGPSLSAANVIALANPLAMVYVINIARGGLGLINWSANPPSYNFRQAIQGNVSAALTEIGLTEIDCFVFGGAESDANNQSQTISADFENYIMNWLKSNSWFNVYTPTYIFGFTPYACSAPGNSDYLWRRYSGALKECVATDPSNRAYIGLDEFPISLFDATGAIPYIHRTGEGYYQSGLKLGNSILNGISEPVLKSYGLDGLYAPIYSNGVNCSVAHGYATFTRIGNTIDVSIRVTATASAANADTSFDITVPIKAKTFPAHVSGIVASPNGDSGIVVGVASTQAVKVVYRSKFSGPVAMCINFRYRVNPSDCLPNSPTGTT